MEASSPLRVDLEADTAVVTLDRPDVRNALSTELRQRLREVIEELDARDDVRSIVLTGTDPAFCSGVDLRELGSSMPPDDLTGPRGDAFLTCRTPLVAAVNGPAYTGGLELVLACHLAVASERATFADTHAAHGLVPGWGLTALLADSVGPRRARWMILTGTPIPAHTALEWGLVNAVVPHGDVVDKALALARAVSSAPSSRRISALLDAQTARRVADALTLEANAWGTG